MLLWLFLFGFFFCFVLFVYLFIFEKSFCLIKVLNTNVLSIRRISETFISDYADDDVQLYLWINSDLFLQVQHSWVDDILTGIKEKCKWQQEKH